MDEQSEIEIIENSEILIEKQLSEKYNEGLNAESNHDYLKAYNCYLTCTDLYMAPNPLATLENKYLRAKDRVINLLRSKHDFKPLHKILNLLSQEKE